MNVLLLRQLNKAVVYSLASIACPILFVVGGAVYLHFRDREFWGDLTPRDTNNAAGAMMAFAEIGTLFICLLVGCFFGLLLGFAATRAKGKVTVFSVAAMILNAFPLTAVGLWLVRNWLMS